MQCLKEHLRSFVRVCDLTLSQLPYACCPDLTTVTLCYPLELMFMLYNPMLGKKGSNTML